MHFPIIAIESLKTEKADFTTELDYEDSTLNRYCDYYGDKYDEEEETITFLDEETIRGTIRNYLIQLTENLHSDAEKGELSVFDLRLAAKEYKGFSTLFYTDGFGQTSFEYLEDAPYMAGQTGKIGNIFDAHC